jgi:hypothetical protein
MNSAVRIREVFSADPESPPVPGQCRVRRRGGPQRVWRLGQFARRGTAARDHDRAAGKAAIICFAPQYVCDKMLRAEGFTDIRYVETTPQAISEDLGHGRVDFAANLIPSHLTAFDAGAAITIIGAVHAGCYELFAREGIRGIADLKGKSVGLYGGLDLISAMVAYVGLDPKPTKPEPNRDVERTPPSAVRANFG